MGRPLVPVAWHQPAPFLQGLASRPPAASPPCDGAFTGSPCCRQGNRGSGLQLRCGQWGPRPSAVAAKACVLITRTCPLLSPCHPSSSQVQLSTWGQARQLALAASPNPGSWQTPTCSGLRGSGVGRIGVRPVLGTGGPRKLCPSSAPGPQAGGGTQQQLPHKGLPQPQACLPGKPPRRGGGKARFLNKPGEAGSAGGVHVAIPRPPQLHPLVPGSPPAPAHPAPFSNSVPLLPAGLPVSQEGERVRVGGLTATPTVAASWGLACPRGSNPQLHARPARHPWDSPRAKHSASLFWGPVRTVTDPAHRGQPPA